jgi:abequosyltransferase
LKRTNNEPTIPRLSVCISTYNRANFIGGMLDSILDQLVPGVELIVVDGASTDSTPEVVAQYLSRYPEIRYYREQENCGVDRDYDKSVSYATGEFCWLMTDDDVLRPGALGRVTGSLDSSVDLIVVNAEVKNADFSKVLKARLLDFKKDKEYGGGDHEEFFREATSCLSFIGCVVVRRKWWLERDRSSYYGSLFVHVGVIFQRPPIERVKVIADPLIAIRYGNAMWTSSGFEIWMFKWPRLVWSFSDFSDSTKNSVSPKEPWRQSKRLFLYRATGGYSMHEYHRFLSGKVNGISRGLCIAIAIIPGRIANVLASLYFVVLKRKARIEMTDLLRSRYVTWSTHLAARLMGI